ncbi:laminin subunit alpha-4 isoform X1 [Electrophorus electricus]|uniref:laminin subunit alpha-4 isoform X1 n=2 Tax=Electrophorus electricus TaxID=8005 RepID=UPI0015CFA0F2|nr:laminin subunit alpha-4 isoform X1 [Electrophorus electricus]
MSPPAVIGLVTLLARLTLLRGQQEMVHTVCARGFFMSEQHTCLPCNCKNHSHTCEDITGLCIDCQDHSTGDFCERCEDGYLLHQTPGSHECRPCSCPISLESNNFAAHCDKKGVVLRCVCQEGYAGHYCERCAPGYYGNPMRVGDSCKKCECNGNSDPNLIFSECHNVTGQCLHCWGNTHGDHCERCTSGYYGDAIIAKDCQECQCNKCGTASCDDRTGVCHCKPGVSGQLCDQCEEGFSGFSSCMGCQRCKCSSAALHTMCNQLTHSCQCHPGAGGRYCERCLPGHWDYSPSGCKKCDCPEGSCDMHTGECMPESFSVSECNIDCDDCIWNLIGDIHKSNKTLVQLRTSVLNISTGAAANDRLKFYNYTAVQLSVRFVGWRNTSAVMRSQTDQLDDTTAHLHTDMELLTQQEEDVQTVGTEVDKETLHSSMQAEALMANLTSLSVLIDDIIGDWAQYGVHQKVDPDVLAEKQQQVSDMVLWMRALTLSPRQPLAMDEYTHAQELLRHVRQLEKRLVVVEDQIPAVRDLLKRLTSKLSHAQNLLHRADDTLQQTHSTHATNQIRLRQREDQQQHFMQNYEAVNQTIQEATGIVSEADVGVVNLGIMIKNISEYHAEVDGAGASLKEKTEYFSQVDRDLVQRAATHADQLDRHADELQHNLKGSDTDRLVQKALQASSVYDNIIKYIDDANITSLTTLNLSVRADDAIDGLKSQLSFLKTQSDHIFKEAASLHSQYQEDVLSTLTDTKMYTEETNDMMETSRKKLAEILNDIRAMQKGRTPARLQFTQAVVEGTLNRSAEVLGAMTPIREQVEEWSRNMRNDQYSTSAYNQAVTSARNTVSSLSEVVPELLSKLRVVEEKKTATNISINILRVRELIAQARSVARKVQVSMKFNGQSAVELHPHPSMEELKAVTSISLYVRVDPDKDPIEDRFLLYLGDKNGRKDYMGLAIKNDNLVYVYNLGGEDVEIPLSSKPVSSWPPVFNLIRVERLGRHGKVFLTVPSQDSVAEQKFIQKGEADGTDSIFHLDRKDTVFIIGGVPPDVKLPPALSLAPFVGCVELATLNNEVISLYNFRKLHKMDVTTSVPCPRYKLAFSQGRVASYLFDGTGYALVSNIERRGRIGVVTRFDIEVRTVANNGILFLMVNQSDFFVLELRNGFLRLVYDFGYSGGPVVLESNLTKLQINDARYHEVSVIYHFSKKMILLVDRSYVKAVESEKKTLPFSDIYIGGAPSSLLLSRPELSSLVGLKGCVKGFQFQKKDFNLLEEPGTIGISSGCPEESFMSRKAYFTGQGYLGSSGKISPFSSFEGGLNFNTQQPSGLLYYHRQGSDEFTLSLENGAVVLHSRGTKVRSNKKNYNDGRSHFLLASVTKQIYQLVIDDKDKQEKTNPDASSPPDSPVKMFYYGGSPHSKISNFTGCISHAYLSRQDRDIEAEDFQRYTEHVQVSLQDCPEERPPASLLPASVRRSSAPSRKVSRNKRGMPQGILGYPLGSPETETKPCHLSPHPRSTRHAHHYGGSAQSRREYDGIAEVIRERCHFSLSVRTRSASGLLFYVSDGSEEDFMALFLSDGKLLFSFGSSQQRLLLSSRDKHNDGHWHNVICSREGALGRLIVDGVAVVEQGLPNSTTSLHLQDPLYVAGVPPGHAQKNLQMSSEFSGCLRGFQLNGGWMTSASRSFGVTPCYEGSMEPGTYFSEEGGYVVLDDSFNLGLKFELVMEVRPRVSSGVLLHVFTAAQEYLTLHLRYSQVTILVNSSEGVFSTDVSPKGDNFCDGNWHKITVIRDMKMVHLGVDSEMKHVVTAEPLHTERPRAPVFIGGAPDSLLPVSMRSVRNYTGCVRNLLVNKSPVSFSRAALVSGAVSVGTCPVA